MRAFGVLVGALAPREDYSAIDALFPVSVDGFVVAQRTGDGASYRHPNGLAVICSIAPEEDGRRWLHVSCSRRARLPSYDDMVAIKQTFIGPEREAYSVWPRADKHVNIHPFCLHLWCCLDVAAGAVLPDFTRGGGSI